MLKAKAKRKAEEEALKQEQEKEKENLNQPVKDNIEENATILNDNEIKIE